jgi:hypothetical protein
MKIILTAILLTACGGSRAASSGGGTATRTAHKKAAPVVPQPLEVKASATRQGTALRVMIDGIGRGHGEGETFEDPTAWEISARVDGQPLKKVVNGPMRVERLPVGEVDGDAWDVTVNFSTYFELPDGADKVELHVAPPPPDHSVTLSIDLP